MTRAELRALNALCEEGRLSAGAELGPAKLAVLLECEHEKRANGGPCELCLPDAERPVGMLEVELGVTRVVCALADGTEIPRYAFVCGCQGCKGCTGLPLAACGREQGYAPAWLPGGVTVVEATALGWKRTERWWLCPFCSGNEEMLRKFWNERIQARRRRR